VVVMQVVVQVGPGPLQRGDERPAPWAGVHGRKLVQAVLEPVEISTDSVVDQIHHRDVGPRRRRHGGHRQHASHPTGTEIVPVMPAKSALAAPLIRQTANVDCVSACVYSTPCSRRFGDMCLDEGQPERIEQAVVNLDRLRRAHRDGEVDDLGGTRPRRVQRQQEQLYRLGRDDERVARWYTAPSIR